MHFLTSWDCCRNGDDGSADDGNVENGNGSGDNANDGNANDGKVNDGKVNGGNVNGGNGGPVNDVDDKTENALMSRRARDGLTVNLLRNLCHVFYFDCNQVKL